MGLGKDVTEQVRYFEKTSGGELTAWGLENTTLYPAFVKFRIEHPNFPGDPNASWEDWYIVPPHHKSVIHSYPMTSYSAEEEEE